MTVYEISKKVHLQQWAEEWREQLDSGLSAKSWCEVHSISYNTFRSHTKAVRNSLLNSPNIQTAIENATTFNTEEVMDENPVSVPKLDIAQVHLESEAPVHKPTQPDIHIELRNMIIDINNTADLEHLGYILGVLLNVKF